MLNKDEVIELKFIKIEICLFCAPTSNAHLIDI